MYTLKLNIDGQDRGDTDFFDVVNPLQRKVVGRCASASDQDCIDACDAAERAFATWQTTSVAQRRAILLKTAELLESKPYQQRMLEMQQLETAASEPFVRALLMSISGYFRGAADMSGQLRGIVYDSERPGAKVMAQKRPAGVVLSCVPWNAPTVLTGRATAVPLLCGNTVVLKASEYAPHCVRIVAEALWEAGLPKGVVNFLAFDRDVAAQRTETIIAHRAVRRVNFTGSDVVGRKIAALCGKHLIPFIGELGGKNATVVLEDADLEAAARSIVYAANVHSGQVCAGTERVIVHHAVADRLNALLKYHTARLHAGQGQALGSLFRESAATNVLSHIKEAAEQPGVNVEVGDLKRDGAVVQPHLLTNVPARGGSFWFEETFGPVTMVTEATSDDHAIELANDSDYSLTAALWTKDVNKAMTYGQQLRNGITMINGPSVWMEREHGIAGLGGRSGYGRFDVEAFTDVRTIVFCSGSQQFMLSEPAPPNVYQAVKTNGV